MPTVLREPSGGAWRLTGLVRGGVGSAHAGCPPGLRLGTPRRAEDPAPSARTLEWTPARTATSAACARTRLAGAAPPPSLTRTGEPDTRRQPFDEDGTRARTQVAVAAHHRPAARPSSRQCCWHLHPCVVPPCVVGTWTRQARQDTRAPADNVGVDTAGKNEKIRAQEPCVS
jgi:hypothetical protein